MDKKLIIFLLAFFALFFAYQKFVLEPMVKARKPAPSTISSPAPAPSASQTAASSAPAEQAPAVKQAEMTPTPATPTGEANVRKAVVDTPLYRAEFNNRGAVLTSFRLKKYQDDFNQPLEMVPQEKDIQVLPLSFDFENKDLTAAATKAIYSMDRESLSLTGTGKGTLDFSYSDGNNTFHKKITFRADSYLLGMSVEADVAGKPVPVRIAWSPGVESFTNYKNRTDLHPSQAVINIGDKVERKQAKKVEQFQKMGATVRWSGLEDNYFAAIFIPSQPTDAYLNPVPGDEKYVHSIALYMVSQQPGPQELTVFVGPKDYMLLKHIGMDLERAVDFGFWAPIVKTLFLALHWMYRYTTNYGWAIVVLTFLIKLIFTPFMQKSFASQKKMQAMQPEMKQIQDKYAKLKNDDPRKAQMNTEIMALHKRYGVNPLGGCLPMVVQMPVLIGFYRLLSSAIELRHAPFMLWLTDLSKPDPYYVTPVLMGASMMIQQRMTPVSDPMQKNMMFIMPIMFTFMSFKLQSGLVLYWLLSNLLGLLHQWLFQQQQKRAAVAA